MHGGFLAYRFQLLHLFGCGAFLRGKQPGGSVGTIQLTGHIGGHHIPHLIAERMDGRGMVRIHLVFYPFEHTAAHIAGGTAAQTNHNLPAPAFHGMENQLSQSVAGGLERVPFTQLQQGQANYLGALDVGGLSFAQVATLDGAHQWVVHLAAHVFATHSLLQGGEPSFAPVAHHKAYHLCVRTHIQHALSRSLIGLCRTQATLKRIYGYNYFHLFIITKIQR